MQKISILTILKRSLGIIFGAGSVYLLALFVFAVSRAGFRAFFDLIYLIIIFIFFTSIIVFCVFWNIRNSKLVYRLLLIPPLSIVALTVLTMLAACARNPPETLEQVWARVEAERQAEREALISPIAAQWQEVNIEYLREHRAYPRGYFVGRDIFILTVENNYPVVKRVDLIGGELTVINEMTLDRISHNIGNYIVLGGTRSFSFNTALNSPHASISFTNNIFRTLRTGGQTNLRFVEKVGQEIPEEVFWRTTDSQQPYVGTFVFDELQIIYQYNYEITQERLEWYSSVQINISLGPDRRLIAELGDRVLSFNINPNAWDGGRTIGMGGANGGHGGMYRYLFIADENTIYNRYFSFHHPHDWNTGERLPGGHHIRYAVRYVRQ